MPRAPDIPRPCTLFQEPLISTGSAPCRRNGSVGHCSTAGIVWVGDIAEGRRPVRGSATSRRVADRCVGPRHRGGSPTGAWVRDIAEGLRPRRPPGVPAPRGGRAFPCRPPAGRPRASGRPGLTTSPTARYPATPASHLGARSAPHKDRQATFLPPSSAVQSGTARAVRCSPRSRAVDGPRPER